MGCLLEAIIKLSLFLLLLWLWSAWNDSDLVGRGFENRGITMQELVVTV